MRKNWLIGLVALVAASATHARELRATPNKTRVEVFATPRLAGRAAGYLEKDVEVEVVGRSADARAVQLLVSRRNSERVRVWGRARDFSFRKVDPQSEIEKLPVVETPPPGAPAETVEEEAAPEASKSRCRISHPWAYGASFGGYSAGGTTNATVSGDIRYLWCTWTETIVGLDLGFGSEFVVGARAGERFYAAFDNFRPFVHAGYRIFDLSQSETSALELGGGFQVVYGERSYFEVQVLYLWHSVFGEGRENAIVFGGGSGLRF